MGAESVKVCIRVRPFNRNIKRESEESGVTRIVDMSRTAVYLTDPSDTTGKKKAKQFTFDRCFWSFDNDIHDFEGQDVVYNFLGKDMLNQGLKGLNYTILSYGQTGSGKSYSVTGPRDDPGIVPRVAKELFDIVANPPEDKRNIRFEVKTSYLEVYNEQVRDLLVPKPAPLEVKMVPKKVDPAGVIIEGLDRLPVNSFESISKLLYEGLERRSVASTACNQGSSRSHSVFTIYFTQYEHEDPKIIKQLEGIPDPAERADKKKRYLAGLKMESQLHLVDLAGSERAEHTGAKGQQMREACAINRSLSSLGRVIEALAKASTGKGKGLIPYRDSSLTMILSNSLGGNAMTSMIAAVSPAHINYDETLSTLRYANNAKKIKNQPTVNTNPDKALIKDLQEKVKKLEAIIAKYGSLENMEQGLEADEEQKKKMQEDYERKMEQQRREFEEMLRKERDEAKKGSHVAVIERCEAPHLVNLNEDPQLSETAKYLLDFEQTIVGSDGALSGITGGDDKKQNAILLQTAGVNAKHCVLSYEPVDNADMWKEHFAALDEARAKELESKMVGSPSSVPPPSLITSMPIPEGHAVFLYVEEGCDVFINGDKFLEIIEKSEESIQTSGKLMLRHNDRVIFGSASMFRFNHFASEDAYLQKIKDAGFTSFVPRKFDFHTAHHEYSSKQLETGMSKKQREENEAKIREMEEMMQKQREEAEKAKAALEEQMKQLREKQDEEAEKERQKVMEEMQRQKQEMEEKQKELEKQLKEKQKEAHRQEMENDILNADLSRTLPLVQEAKVLSKELKRPEFMFDTTIAIDADSNKDSRSSTVMVRMKDMKKGIQISMPSPAFENRVFQMREMFRQYREEGSIPELDAADDPYFLLPDAELIGKVSLMLNYLGMCQPHNGRFSIAPFNREEAGSMDCQVYAYAPAALPEEWAEKLRKGEKEASVPEGEIGVFNISPEYLPTVEDLDGELIDYMDPIEDDVPKIFMTEGSVIDIVVKITRLAGLPSDFCEDPFCEFELLGEKVRTPLVEGRSVNPVMNFTCVIRQRVSGRMILSFGEDSNDNLVISAFASPALKPEIRRELEARVKGNSDREEERKRKEEEEERRNKEEEARLEREEEERNRREAAKRKEEAEMEKKGISTIGTVVSGEKKLPDSARKAHGEEEEEGEKPVSKATKSPEDEKEDARVKEMERKMKEMEEKMKRMQEAERNGEIKVADQSTESACSCTIV
ncbi:Kinesin-like protein KIF13B [Aduncisulcus paluster]|uniref:Kinesin-like protein KIF13B n=1 Tax=Aduncisulcus paluster TaxID=2918883 RepID=A0ABQ5K786_9EUKA|nr:Kinesin-like protein KIF13B [Aduncisulcus paluster]|eukprot:gnl/Carplike_NY0171/443_a613_1372.p1 GENE.gnl/Carplike_NY0171/443_a613_1372~~gnl/Carplike_NY0171/443_a613_1372.p1  ORF type:complete len:1226 (+),score=502.95 gnl/Carplike_NY0171/443_a613_1372:106-3783(+)